MFTRNFLASALKIAIRVRYPGFGKFGLLALTLIFTQCTMTDDMSTDWGGEAGGRDWGVVSGKGGPGMPGRGSDSTRLPQAGQLTAGEIDDHLNFPQFKTYVQRALQTAQTPNLELSLPNGSAVKDRFPEGPKGGGRRGYARSHG